jgi:EAL domain-containing protein (putative c-di-GMP-specific phosphodiesterase class I)
MQALVRKLATIQETAAPNTAVANINAQMALGNAATRIFSNLPKGFGWASIPFNTLTLSSQYQPIFSLEDKRAIGYEALVVGTNLSGHEFRADTVFALSANHDEELFLDWLSRALHLRNFSNMGAARGLLFLNAYPAAAVEDPRHPEVFSRMIDFYNVNPSEVVVEILETGVDDEIQLSDAAKLYRKMGCKIAIDDFGVGYSNFDRLWRLQPDIVKLDGSIIRSAARDKHARIVLANMVKLVKECDAKIAIEGIENSTEAKLAIDVGADYLQGYFFGRPGKNATPREITDRIFESLSDNSSNVAEDPAAVI